MSTLGHRQLLRAVGRSGEILLTWSANGNRRSSDRKSLWVYGLSAACCFCNRSAIGLQTTHPHGLLMRSGYTNSNPGMSAMRFFLYDLSTLFSVLIRRACRRRRGVPQRYRIVASIARVKETFRPVSDRRAGPSPPAGRGCRILQRTSRRRPSGVRRRLLASLAAATQTT